jgi:hypothetical protein
VYMRKTEPVDVSQGSGLLLPSSSSFLSFFLKISRSLPTCSLSGLSF